MMDNIDIFLLDNTNNIIEEINIIKPETYQQLNIELKNNFKNLPENYTLFYPSSNNNDIEIHNDEDYQLLKDILFVHQINNKNLEESLFQVNYNKIVDSNKENLDDKYTCSICSERVKNEKPLFCYICQKIYHHKCLKQWDRQITLQNQDLSCPNCRNVLPLNKWREKLDFEDNIKNDENIMNELDVLKNENDKKNNLIKNYGILNEKVLNLFKLMLTKINKMSSLINKEHINNKILNIIKELPQPNAINNIIDEISNSILEELEVIEQYIKHKEDINYLLNEINFGEPKLNDNKNNDLKINDSKNNDIKMNENKNEINLVYMTETEGEQKIFGKKFVESNKSNIELIINGEKSCLIDKFKLKKGENIIKIIILNKINDLSYMFNECSSLKNIEELKYLDTKDINDFSYMFFGCSSLEDIKPLANWNVTKSNNFSYMFFGCSSLKDIKPLINWNVSNCKNFSYMFCGCSSLEDTKLLQTWNVDNFEEMFNLINF